MTDDTTDTTTDEIESTADQSAAAATAASASTYKVLGEIDADSGTGVLGRNTANTGTPIGIEGAVPNATSGYGLATTGNARVGGTAELNALGGSVTGGQTITDLLGDGLTVSSGSLSADPARPDLDDGTTSVTDADALTLGSGLRVVDDGDGTATVRLDRDLTWWEGTELVASTTSTTTEFGKAVALSDDGTTALVGEPSTDPNVKGKANAFVRSGQTWRSVARFIGSQAEDEDGFGFAVALSGDGTTGMVGAYKENTFEGYVDVLDGSDWSSPSVLQSFDGPQQTSLFGLSVAFGNGGAVGVVGAPGDNGSTSFAGQAFVYESEGDWTSTSGATTKLEASTVKQDEYLGYSVAVDDDATTILAGAPYRTNNPGSAYVFETSSGWSGVSNETATLTASDATSGSEFGESAAIDGAGDLAFVGAPQATGASKATNASGAQTGAAYVYDGSSGWDSATEVAKLVASDATSGFKFGQSVAIDREATRAVVGAPEATTGSGARTGAAYVFDGSGGWDSPTETAKLVASQASSGAEYGTLHTVGVADDATNVFVGAPDDLDPSGSRTGTVIPYYGVE